jgi:hypothetical protein
MPDHSFVGFFGGAPNFFPNHTIEFCARRGKLLPLADSSTAQNIFLMHPITGLVLNIHTGVV